MSVHLRGRFVTVVAGACVCVLATATAQELAPWTPPAANADQEAMHEHLKAAKDAAGLDLYGHFTHRCLFNQAYGSSLGRHNEWPAAIEPLQVFDNLYSVGQNAVSAWVLRTSAGLILFDTLNSADEAKTYIAGGLTKLGLNPSDIKYIVVTHGHGDHFNGAKYLQDTYGARLMASNADWDLMTRSGGRGGRGNGPAPPLRARGLEISDGFRFTLADTTLTFYVTPGHTAGTVSTIFKTTDGGTPHVVGFFGGLGTPASAEAKRQMVASFDRFAQIAAAAGVDTLIANHQTQDRTKENLELLRMRRPGDPNPYVIGSDAYRRYLVVQRECTLYGMARQGQK